MGLTALHIPFQTGAARQNNNIIQAPSIEPDTSASISSPAKCGYPRRPKPDKQFYRQISRAG